MANSTVGGLILLSTSTSLPEVAARTLPWLPMRWIVRTRFENLDKIARVSAPKLFIHGRQDERVPFDMAEEQLFAAAPRAPRGDEGAFTRSPTIEERSG